MKQYVFFFLGVLLLSGCNQGDERLKEKSQIEGKEAAAEEIKVQNENLAQKALEMEEDLKIRHRFYQAVKGTYEGNLETEKGTRKIKLTIVPSLPPYTFDRIRQLDEIVDDLNNLYLNVQVIQWNPENPLSAIGCRIENIRPDIVSGTIAIASENCENFYGLWIAQANNVQSIAEIPQSSKLNPMVSMNIAQSILQGHYDTVLEIQGEVHPTTNATVYEFSAMRKVK